MGNKIDIKMMNIVAYLRVSTDKQDVENQKFEINRYCSNKGISVTKWIIDKNVSGKKKSYERKLWDGIKGMGSGDILIITEISRIGRDWFDILSTINECLVNNISVHAIKNGYELKNDAMGKLFVSIMAVFAEEERKLLSERIKMALSRKKKESELNGERFNIGRPVGFKVENRKLDDKKEEIKNMLGENISILKMSKILNCHRNTLNNYIEEKMN